MLIPKNLTCVRVGGNVFASQVQWLKGQILLLRKKIIIIAQYSSVQLPSRVGLCDPMNCSTPGLPVHHHLPEFTQPHVHWVSDAIQPSHPLSSPSPAINLSQHQGLFKWVRSSHRVAKVLEFQLHCPSNEQPGLISFRIEWTGWISLQSKDSQESSSTPHFKSINSSALSFLYRPTIRSIHDHWKNHSLD